MGGLWKWLQASHFCLDARFIGDFFAMCLP